MYLIVEGISSRPISAKEKVQNSLSCSESRVVWFLPRLETFDYIYGKDVRTKNEKRCRIQVLV